MRLVKRGAEADIFLVGGNDGSHWGGGKKQQPVILKARKPKAYRHPELDRRIRKQRTVHEASIMSQVKSFGVPSPLVYLVDTRRFEIVMQQVPGTLVRDLPPSKLVSCCRQIGRIAGLLHKNGVMHGDLTTSNFILSRGRVHVIDFGLAVRTARPEDHAVDLRLIKEILNSAHAGVMGPAWAEFLGGYARAVGRRYADRVLGLVSVIEGRGRYAVVV